MRQVWGLCGWPSFGVPRSGFALRGSSRTFTQRHFTRRVLRLSASGVSRHRADLRTRHGGCQALSRVALRRYPRAWLDRSRRVHALHFGDRLDTLARVAPACDCVALTRTQAHRIDTLARTATTHASATHHAPRERSPQAQRDHASATRRRVHTQHIERNDARVHTQHTTHAHRVKRNATTHSTRRASVTRCSAIATRTNSARTKKTTHARASVTRCNDTTLAPRHRNTRRPRNPADARVTKLPVSVRLRVVTAGAFSYGCIACSLCIDSEDQHFFSWVFPRMSPNHLLPVHGQLWGCSCPILTSTPCNYAHTAVPGGAC